MLQKLVQNRKLSSNNYPKGIIVIRDGLSEGEFTSVILNKFKALIFVVFKKFII